MNAKKISLLALFLALSVAGASIKIPAVISSVALDVVPALLASILIGTVPGMLIAGLGHLLSALIGGMPLGAMHLLIAVEMILLVGMFSVIYRKQHKWVASILFIIGNTLVAPVPFIFIISPAFYIGMIPSLLIGSVLNTIIAVILAPRLASVFAGSINKQKEVTK